MTKTKTFKTLILSLLLVFMAVFGITGIGALQASASETDDGVYVVTVDENIQNGTVTADITNAAKGETVTLTVSPSFGYELDVLTVDGVDVTADVSDNEYSFAMPASDVTVTATFKTMTLYVKVFDWTNKEHTYVEPTLLTDPDGDGNYEITLRVLVTAEITVGLGLCDEDGNLLSGFQQSIMAFSSNGAPILGIDIHYSYTLGDSCGNAYFKTGSAPVVVESSENGTVSVDKELFDVGETVTLTVTPAEGYELDTLTASTRHGSVQVTDNTFVMPSYPVTVRATFKAMTLYVKAFDWTNQELTYVEPALLTDPDGDGTYESSLPLHVTADISVELGLCDEDGNLLSGFQQTIITVSLNGASALGIEICYSYTLGSSYGDAFYKTVSAPVVVESSENGTVSVDKALFDVGETVTLTVTPAKGYELDTLTVTDRHGFPVEVTDNTFVMTSSQVTVTATFKALPKANTGGSDDTAEDGGCKSAIGSVTAGAVALIGAGALLFVKKRKSK